MRQEIVRLVKSAVICIVCCIFIAAIVALLLRTPFLAEQKAFLYRLLVMTALSCALLLVASILLYIRRETFWGLSFSASVLCIGLSTLVMAVFFSLGPMTIERSYTIYSLAYMADHTDETYTAEEIKTQFIEGYIEGARESQKRIDEQVYIGNMEETAGGYRITPKGRRLIELFRTIETVFPVPDQNSIYPNK